ncbi:MAG: ABC transporter permease [Clostridia bacterium]|nr:ABC transporter permease [Clostridia bacterium]
MKNNLWNMLKKELREMFRDKKSLAMMLVIPIFIPLLVIGMSALFDAQMNKDISEYNKIGFAYEITEEEKNIAKEINIEIVNGTEEDLKQKYENEEINLYITKKDNNTYIINTNSSENSTYAKNLVKTYFDAYEQYKNIELADKLQKITLEENLLDEDNFFVNYIKNYAFLFIIMAITVSATYPSTDTTAGEKERGTLETLLTFPIKSKDIILGKFLAVSISSIITGTLSLLLSMLSLVIAQDRFSIYEGINIMYDVFTFYWKC